jgi:hypothetical protein
VNRTAWNKAHTRCWLCGSRDRLETHEMVGGSQRSKAVRLVALWFRACQPCHETLNVGKLVERLAWQIAVKIHEDTFNFAWPADLAVVNRLAKPTYRGDWAKGPVTVDDVLAEWRQRYGDEPIF